MQRAPPLVSSTWSPLQVALALQVNVVSVHAKFRVHTGRGKSGKILEFEKKFFRSGKTWIVIFFDQIRKSLKSYGILKLSFQAFYIKKKLKWIIEYSSQTVSHEDCTYSWQKRKFGSGMTDFGPGKVPEFC